MTDAETTKNAMALLAAWMQHTPREYLPAVARDDANAVFKNKTARKAAISLATDGVTVEDVQGFVAFWQKRENGIELLYFQILANEILAWKRRRAPRPTDYVKGWNCCESCYSHPCHCEQLAAMLE